METTIKYLEKEGVQCIVCNKGFSDDEWENRHWVHQNGCPFLVKHEPLQCDCEDVAHEEHCPQCCLGDLEEQLKEHCLDSYGNIYTVTVEQLKNTALEFVQAHPELIEKIRSLDMASLAYQIQDYIGGVGITDHIEIAVSEAIRDEIRRATETLTEARHG